MTLQIPEVVPTRIDRCVYTIMGNTMPPRDPNDDEEDEDDERLRSLALIDVKAREIGMQLNRTEHAVRSRAMRLKIDLSTTVAFSLDF